MKLQKPPENYNVLTAIPGFPSGYFTILGEQVKEGASKKPPMLVVGSRNYFRDKIDLTIQAQYDVYMFFYPTNSSIWKVGVFLADKNDCRKYYSVYIDDLDIKQGYKKCFKAIEDIVPLKFREETDKITANDLKLAAWTTAWIYRLPKIALKDVILLEEYTERKVL